MTPAIPVGLATKLGVLFAALSGSAALVAAILKGDHRPETIAALLTAAAPIYAVIKGRMEQATAHAAKTLAPSFTVGAVSPPGSWSSSVQPSMGGTMTSGAGQETAADVAAIKGHKIADPGEEDGDDRLPAELTDHPVDSDILPDEVNLPHGTVQP